MAKKKASRKATPRKRPPLAERTSADVIALVASDLATHQYKHQIKKHVKTEFGYDYSPPEFEKLMSFAREHLLLNGKKTRVQARAEALAVYEKIIRDNPGEASISRHRAQERLDAIYGTDAKFGNVEDADDVAARVRLAIAAAKASVPNSK